MGERVKLDMKELNFSVGIVYSVSFFKLMSILLSLDYISLSVFYEHTSIQSITAVSSIHTLLHCRTS